MELLRPSLETGQLFANRYRIEAALGAGAMGKVYLAADTMLPGEKVALKVLNIELCEDDSLAARFLRKVQLTRKVTHPNVVRTYDVGSEQGRLYFTMEHVAGQTLRQKVANGPLDLLEISNIVIQLCQGLSAIHDCNIVHRDLKSANVIVTADGIVKISDFGVARPGASEMTGQDELLGSATHMSPEVWRQGEVSTLTDIYALGVIVYELSTGVLPFEGSTPHELMWKHLRSPVVPPLEVNPEVPRWLNSLILRMLEKDPGLRPQSAREIMGDIKLALKRTTRPDLQKSGLLQAGTEANESQEHPLMTTSNREEGGDTRSGYLEDIAVSKAPEQGKLAQFSFSIAPAAMEQDISKSTAIVKPAVYVFQGARAVGARSLPQTLSELLSRVGGVLLACILGAAVLFIFFQGGPKSGPNLSPLTREVPKPLLTTLGLVLSLIGWIAALAVPFLLSITCVAGFKQGLRLWLRGAALASAILLTFFVYHATRLAFPALHSSLKPIPSITVAAVQAAAVNGAEVALFKVRGTHFQVIGHAANAALLPVAPPNFEKMLPYLGLLLAYLAFLLALLAPHYRIHYLNNQGLGLALMGCCLVWPLALQLCLEGKPAIWGIPLERLYPVRMGLLRHQLDGLDLLTTLSTWALLTLWGLTVSLLGESRSQIR